MPIIKLDATGSTNDFLRDLLKETKLDDYTVVWADYQHSGRGQRERSWQSDRGKNLIVSILKRHERLSASQQFNVSRAVALAIIQMLKALNIPDLSIKWPNDILSGNRKICGILIENSLQGKMLNHSIIGIGLNVNQSRFEDLPYAGSLFQISGTTYDRDVLIYQLLAALKKELAVADNKGLSKQKEQYLSCLYQRGQTVSFEHASTNFMARVEGVTDAGELELLRDSGDTERFAKGEIRWVTETV